MCKKIAYMIKYRWIEYINIESVNGLIVEAIVDAAIGTGIGYIASYIGSVFSSFAAQEFTIGELVMTTVLLLLVYKLLALQVH